MPALKHRGSRTELLILGPYPPPFGGVSIHIQQLVRAARRAGIDAVVANHFGTVVADEHVMVRLKRNPLRYAFVTARENAKIVHYHHSHWSTLVATAVGARFTDSHLILTAHGDTLVYDLNSRIPLIAFLTRRALTRVDRIIAVSDDLQQRLTRLLAVPIDVIPASSGRACRSLPSRIASDGDRRSFVLAAYRVGVSKKQDIYGVGLALEALAEAVRSGLSAELKVFVANPPKSGRERRYFRGLRRMLEADYLDALVRWHFGERLTDHLRGDSVFLRPTFLDGDSVSVREALTLGADVIASDAAVRPPGCRVFAKGNVLELARSMAEPTSQGAQVSLESDIDLSDDEESIRSILRVYGTTRGEGDQGCTTLEVEDLRSVEL